MKCLICNKESSISGILLHIRKTHSLTSKNYYDLYLKKENEGLCLICKKETKFDRFKYSAYCRGCSNKDPIVKEKKKQTSLKNYGVENPNQSKEIQEKKKQTCLEKYGVENPNQSKEIQEKKKQTCLEKYGVENPYQSKTVQDKYKKTCLEKYGIENPFSLDTIKIKIKETCLDKYGVENPIQSVNIRNKHKESCLSHYGVDNPSKSNIVKQKKQETCVKNWGSDYFVSSRIGKEMARNEAIKRIEKQQLNGEPLSPCIGENERICLNELQKYTEYKIKRNLKFLGYFIDGYIEELKIAIEFDERHHFLDTWKTYNQKDLDRELELASFLPCIIFRVKEIDWITEKQSFVIEQFKILVRKSNE